MTICILIASLTGEIPSEKLIICDYLHVSVTQTSQRDESVNAVNTDVCLSQRQCEQCLQNTNALWESQQHSLDWWGLNEPLMSHIREKERDRMRQRHEVFSDIQYLSLKNSSGNLLRFCKVSVMKHNICSGGKKNIWSLLILYICPLTKKWSVYNFNGRFI